MKNKLLTANDIAHQNRKWTIILFTAAICLIIALNIAVRISLNRPEKQMSQDFLLRNEAIQEIIGNIITIKYLDVGSISFSNENRSGKYTFKVYGEIKNIIVVIYWQTTKEKGYEAKEIILEDLFGGKETPIWKNENIMKD